MGMYDSVFVICPKCGAKHEFQSKGGNCFLGEYTLENCPDNVLSNVNRHSPKQCGCGVYIEVDIKNRKPVIKPKNLVLKIGHDVLRIDLYYGYVTKNPTCRVTCIEDDTHSQDLDGEWIEERNEAVVYLKKEHINDIIDKLNEAKEFL